MGFLCDGSMSIHQFVPRSSLKLPSSLNSKDYVNTNELYLNEYKF